MKIGVNTNGNTGRRSSERGHSVVEAAFLAPWLFFLFVGALDFGFYAYGMIATQTAARVAALYTSSSQTKAADSTGACTYALGELRKAPNIGNGVTSCGSLPLQVTAQSVTGADGKPASRVSVTYQSIIMIPIPGFLTNQITITRIVEMRVRPT